MPELCEDRAESISRLERKEHRLNLARHLPLFYIPLSAIIKPIIFHGKNPFDYVIEQGNTSMALAIGGLAAVAFGEILKSRNDQDEMQIICKNRKREECQILVRTGLYNFCRNPCYLAQTIMAMGFVMIAPAIDTVAALATYLGLTEVTVRTEEKKNELQFGDDYKSYKHSVPRWFSFSKELSSRK